MDAPGGGRAASGSLSMIYRLSTTRGHLHHGTQGCQCPDLKTLQEQLSAPFLFPGVIQIWVADGSGLSSTCCCRCLVLLLLHSTATGPGRPHAPAPKFKTANRERSFETRAKPGAVCREGGSPSPRSPSSSSTSPQPSPCSGSAR